MTGRTSALRWKHYGSATLVAASLISGGALIGAPAASATETAPSASPSASSGTSQTAPATGRTHRSPRRHANTAPLTGDIAAKVTAAALAKYPDATVRRVDTDSHGTYEAHLVTAGRHLTVKIGRDFAARTVHPGLHQTHDMDGQDKPATAMHSAPQR